jgi:hypothetical protein
MGLWVYLPSNELYPSIAAFRAFVHSPRVGAVLPDMWRMSHASEMSDIGRSRSNSAINVISSRRSRLSIFVSLWLVLSPFDRICQKCPIFHDPGEFSGKSYQMGIFAGLSAQARV